MKLSLIRMLKVQSIYFETKIKGVSNIVLSFANWQSTLHMDANL